MTDKSKPPVAGRAAEVDLFLSQAKAVAQTAREGRLIFALDATLSRQPTWDIACRLQAQMFDVTAAQGGLNIQLVYFRGLDECRASRWLASADALKGLMERIDCRGGETQIERVLDHAAAQAAKARVGALVFVGDAMEENIDTLCASAGKLGMLGVKAFLFQEGHDPIAGQAFAEIARLTGGVHERFDLRAPHSLAGLLRAAAAYASDGVAGLTRLASGEPEARRLLASLGGTR
ncbi:MAG: VWA domain-containing protein [Chelatococcus sp.]|nr:VWA domain-containing protein [Chelatococcus sp.]